MQGKFWTREQVEELLRLAAERPRLSKLEILAGMNQAFPERGFTFNSVDRKLRDEGIRFAQKPGKALTVSKPRVAERRAAPDVAKLRLAATLPARPVAQRPDLFAPDLSGLPGRRFTDLKAGQCKWEISGSKDRFAFRFCGARVVPLPPYAYCACHAQIAYQMPNERKVK